MWVVYVFLGFVGLFVLYRLVQWFLLAEQLRLEGRDINEEMDRLLGLRIED